jgi:hypothetical protein
MESFVNIETFDDLTKYGKEFVKEFNGYCEYFDDLVVEETKSSLKHTVVQLGCLTKPDMTDEDRRAIERSIACAILDLAATATRLELNPIRMIKDVEKEVSRYN